MVTRTFHPLNTKLRSVQTIEANLAIQQKKVQTNLLNKLKMLLLLQINFQIERSWRTTLKTSKQRKRFKRTRLIRKTISEFVEITALGKQERQNIKCGFESERTIFNTKYRER